jgi:hypothetical protein
MTEASIETFAQADLDGLIALVAAEGWTEYTDENLSILYVKTAGPPARAACPDLPRDLLACLAGLRPRNSPGS